MKIKEITPEWLNVQKFDLQDKNTVTINGVIKRDLKKIVDDRGNLVELWSAGWSDASDFLPPAHSYQSATNKGITKGWHIHAVHTDQLSLTHGKIQMCLIDVRSESPTFGHINNLLLDSASPTLLKISPGVFHAWKALSSQDAYIINFQSHPYDSADEIHFPLNSIALDIWETDSN